MNMDSFSTHTAFVIEPQPRSTSHALTSRRCYDPKLGVAPPSIFSGLARHQILKEDERTRHASAQIIKTARNTSLEARRTINQCIEL